MTGYQKKQLMFACRIPVQLTLGYFLHKTVYEEKNPTKQKLRQIPGDLWNIEFLPCFKF